MTFKYPKAPRVQDLPPYPFAIVGQHIRQLNLSGGKQVIRCDVGSPDMSPPNTVIEALIDSASQADTHGYSGYRGLPVFREAVSAYYQQRFGVEIHSDNEVMPLLGSKEGIVNFALATVGPDDVVLVPSLGYPAYSMGAELAEASIVEMPITQENNYLPVFEDIPEDVLKKAKLLWISYPNNPTGAYAPLEFYEEAVAFCRKHEILLCSDNPYMEIMYDGRQSAPSVMQVEGALDVAVEFISCSKTYNMAGWRIGAMVANKTLIDTLLTVKSNVDSGHFEPIYQAAAVAMTTTPQTWLDSRNKKYEERRDKILAALPDVGLAQEEIPKGSLYVWARVEAVDGNDEEYAKQSLENARVSVTPGSFYGQDGKGYVRFSLGITDDNLEEALTRLRDYWANN